MASAAGRNIDQRKYPAVPDSTRTTRKTSKPAQSPRTTPNFEQFHGLPRLRAARIDDLETAEATVIMDARFRLSGDPPCRDRHQIDAGPLTAVVFEHEPGILHKAEHPRAD